MTTGTRCWRWGRMMASTVASDVASAWASVSFLLILLRFRLLWLQPSWLRLLNAPLNLLAFLHLIPRQRQGYISWLIEISDKGKDDGIEEAQYRDRVDYCLQVASRNFCPQLCDVGFHLRPHIRHSVRSPATATSRSCLVTRSCWLMTMASTVASAVASAWASASFSLTPRAVSTLLTVSCVDRS